MGPNFFSFANTELTNDGFICWLIDWCKYPGSELYGVAMDLLALFLQHSAEDLPVTELTIRQQHKNIDMLLEINRKFILVIEDKIDSKEHSDQLRQYRSVVENDFPQYPESNRFFVYLKIGDQSSYEEVTASGYRLIHRNDLLAIFNTHSYIKHPLFQQYREHLQSIENATNAFQTFTLDQWPARAWQGFYKSLQTEKGLTGNHWGYVSNSRGGFWGFWWHYKTFPTPIAPEYYTYLQIEEKRIAFKIEIADPNRPGKEKSAIRNAVWAAFAPLLDHAAESAYLPTKTRFRQGTWMSVAEITGLENRDSLNEAISYAESLLDQLNQKLSVSTEA